MIGRLVRTILILAVGFVAGQVLRGVLIWLGVSMPSLF